MCWSYLTLNISSETYGLNCHHQLLSRYKIPSVRDVSRVCLPRLARLSLLMASSVYYIIPASLISGALAFNAIWRLLRSHLVAKYSSIEDIKGLGQARPEGSKIRGTAVVCGGRCVWWNSPNDTHSNGINRSYAGLSTARVLHDHFERVVIIEPEEWLREDDARRTDSWNQEQKRVRIVQYHSLQSASIGYLPFTVSQVATATQPFVLNALRYLFPAWDSTCEESGIRFVLIGHPELLAHVILPGSRRFPSTTFGQARAPRSRSPTSVAAFLTLCSLRGGDWRQPYAGACSTRRIISTSSKFPVWSPTSSRTITIRSALRAWLIGPRMGQSIASTLNLLSVRLFTLPILRSTEVNNRLHGNGTSWSEVAFARWVRCRHPTGHLRSQDALRNIQLQDHPRARVEATRPWRVLPAVRRVCYQHSGCGERQQGPMYCAQRG